MRFGLLSPGVCSPPEGNAPSEVLLIALSGRDYNVNSKIGEAAELREIQRVKISVVVPAFNEEKLLGAALRSMKQAMQSFQTLGWETELVVCNNNSTDRTAQVAEAEGAKVVFEPINQIGRARNCGAAAATGDWLVFVDADSHPSAELFADVARTIQSGKYLTGGCTVKLDEHFLVANMFNGLWNLVSRFKKWAAGSFIFCEAAAFRAIGGFSKDFYVAEELNLSNRLREYAKTQGKKMIILHRHPLVTSARKLKLYSQREWISFMMRAIFSPMKTQRDPSRCQPWYDGRR